jgi:hypothetical protein
LWTSLRASRYLGPFTRIGQAIGEALFPMPEDTPGNGRQPSGRGQPAFERVTEPEVRTGAEDCSDWVDKCNTYRRPYRSEVCFDCYLQCRNAGGQWPVGDPRCQYWRWPRWPSESDPIRIPPGA